MSNKPSYVAIIGDIVDSRTITNRYGIQQQLNACLNQINDQTFVSCIPYLHTATPLFYNNAVFHDWIAKQKQRNKLHGIASAFKITLGDEFQGLIEHPSLALPIIDYLQRHLHPIQLRFGVGIGKLDTPIIADSPFGMDGPAYHQAREALTILRKSEDMKKEPYATVRIGIEGQEALALAMNASLSLLSTLKSGWTDKQIATISTFMENGEYNQTQTANILGVTQSNVQKTLAAANFYTYINALNSIGGSLELLSSVKSYEER